MRLWILAPVLATILCGCQHFSLLTREDFDRGNVSRVQFARDNYTCQTKAVVEQNMVGGSDTRGVYNDVYVSCMAKLGYRTKAIDMLGIGG